MSIGKIYGLMVIRAKIQPDYFLDVMNWDEVSILLDELEVSSRDSWEQTRLMMWSVIQSQSSKKIKPVDLLPFHWDKKSNTQEITREEIEAFKKRKNLS